MLTHSQLRRFAVVDTHGQRVKLMDLAIELGDAEYPAVEYLLFRTRDKQVMCLPWRMVQRVDPAQRCIGVQDLGMAEPTSAEELGQMLLLKRDILDAMVLDLLNRRATRANDLSLAEEDGTLRLIGADTSAWGVLRRLSRGRFAGRSDIYDWKYIEFLRGDPQAPLTGAKYYRRIERLPPGEIANLSDSLPYLHAAELLHLLPDAIATDTLESLLPERQLQVFEELDEQRAVRFLANMAPDRAADLLGALEPDEAKRFLEQLPLERMNPIIELLRYPSDTAGGIMTNDVLFVAKHLTVAEARQALQPRLKRPDFILFIYVVDNVDTRQLCGVITIRTLLITSDAECIENIMNPYLITIRPLEPAATVAQRVIDSDLAALPVVGQHGQIVGAVTIDAAIAQLAVAGSYRLPRVFS
ncbi:MAG: magnesium transporter [Herpetosiphonaceae bacterium]|nr:magnesium transporter [Herpetosiphonaceae bacterium]